MPEPSFFILRSEGVATRQSATAAAKTAASAGSASRTAAIIWLAVCDPGDADAGRQGQSGGAGHQHDLGAELAQRGGDREPLRA